MGSTKSYISKRPTKYLEHYQDKYQFSFHFFVAMSSGEDSDKDAKDWRKGPRTAYDVQRSKLEKLMKNPEKPVNVPQPRKKKTPTKLQISFTMSWVQVQVQDRVNFTFIVKSEGRNLPGKKF